MSCILVLLKGTIWNIKSNGCSNNVREARSYPFHNIIYSKKGCFYHGDHEPRPLSFMIHFPLALCNMVSFALCTHIQFTQYGCGASAPNFDMPPTTPFLGMYIYICMEIGGVMRYFRLHHRFQLLRYMWQLVIELT